MIRKAIVSVWLAAVVAVAAAPQTPAAQPPQPLASSPRAAASERIDETTNAKIRAEGMERSKVMWIAHYLTDVYGPRPTGSPNHVAAANWALETMGSWGLKNGHLEPFTWRGVGWLPGRASGFITSPVKAALKFEALPWSPSTNGTVSGEVVPIVPPRNPTDAELTEFLVDLAPRVKGAIVMVGAAPNVPVNFNEPPKRIPDDQARARYQPADPNAPARGRGGPGGRGAEPTPAGRLSAQQVTQRINTLLRDNPPAFRIVPTSANRDPGVIVSQNATGQTYDEASQISPGVVLRLDDYGRIARLLTDGTPVSVEFNISNQYFPGGKTSYVTVAEIPGSDKAGEIVMLGGHLDSWTSATGATDNAIGCAIMMEAARILEAIGARPRRTIRVALWSGEEQGTLGSAAYVREHFGSAEAPKPDFAKLDAYWNIDDGTGRVRGASIFGPPEAAAILAQFVKPFEDWGVYGVSATTSRGGTSTDTGPFNQAGLPGIGTLQDPIEYDRTTWHTNLDTYERIVPDDVMKDAIVTASIVLHLADRDEMLPRFAASAMPPRSTGRGGAGTGPGNAATPTMDQHIYVAGRNTRLAVSAPGVLPLSTAQIAPNASAVSATLDRAPSHGAVALRADGSFVYTPASGYTGTDSFSYKVTGAGAGSANAGGVTIIVK